MSVVIGAALRDFFADRNTKEFLEIDWSIANHTGPDNVAQLKGISPGA